MSNSSLRHKTLRGLFWSLFDRLGQQGIQFIIGIILARLLMPEQFGLIAMLGIFMAIAQTFIDSGFGSALIQKKDATHLDESSVFYFNIVLGFLAAGIMVLSAPWIARFYNAPMLIPLTRVLSLNLIIGSFGSIQGVLLTKHLDFKSAAKIGFISIVISGTVGVSMAYLGYGVWSLVAQSIGGGIIRVVLLWYFMPWRPAWRFSLISLRKLFSFGSKMLSSSLLDTIFVNLYTIIIGKLFSAADLGYFTRAQSTQQLPSHSISGIVGRVTFPVFSSIQDDKPRLKQALRKALMTLMLGNFPMMIGLALVARPMVMVLLTEKWLPSVPYLQILCVAGVLYPLHVINLNVLMAQGRSDLFFRLEIIKKVMVAIAIFISYRFGIMGMCYGIVVTSYLAYYINSYYTGKLLNYPITEQIKDFLPSLAISGAMGILVFGIGFVPFPNDWVLLFAQVSAGIMVYGVLCLYFRVVDLSEWSESILVFEKMRFVKKFLEKRGLVARDCPK